MFSVAWSEAGMSETCWHGNELEGVEALGGCHDISLGFFLVLGLKKYIYRASMSAWSW